MNAQEAKPAISLQERVTHEVPEPEVNVAQGPQFSNLETVFLQGTIEGLTVVDISRGVGWKHGSQVVDIRRTLALRFRVNPQDNRLTKAVTTAYLCRAIMAAVDAKVLNTSHLPEKAKEPLDQVETEVLEGITDGENIFDLSKRLGVDMDRGTEHLNKICEKFGVKNIFMAAACWANGIRN